MTNKKGFTLVELLAILVILGIIATISVINIGRQSKMNDDENKKILNQKIENASKIYAAKYYSNMILSGDEIKFTLNDLINDGVLYLSNGQCTSNRGDDIYYTDGSPDYTEIYADDCYQQEE